MWNDREVPPPSVPRLSAKPYLRFDDKFWEKLVPAMKDAGVNLVVLDLGDGVEYASHPEIAVQNAWSVDRLRKEIKRLRSVGIEPIPKLNFSATHDVWLGPYARRVSTSEYYAVCQDLIEECIQIFETPRFFHLGMDEEAAEHQRFCEYVVVRQYDLWWHDCLFLINTVIKQGVRPWVWADYCWRHREEYIAKMPSSVLQSNWWYDEILDADRDEVKAYLWLAKAGFDQVPTTSNYNHPDNFIATLRFVQENLSKQHIVGFLHTVWKPTQFEYETDHKEALRQIARARTFWEREAVVG